MDLQRRQQLLNSNGLPGKHSVSSPWKGSKMAELMGSLPAQAHDLTKDRNQFHAAASTMSKAIIQSNKKLLATVAMEQQIQKQFYPYTNLSDVKNRKKSVAQV